MITFTGPRYPVEAGFQVVDQLDSQVFSKDPEHQSINPGGYPASSLTFAILPASSRRASFGVSQIRGRRENGS